MQIRGLEREIGAELVERRPGEVALTATGIEVALRAERILAATRDLVDFARHRQILSGPLKLGIIPTLAPYLLPRLLPREVETAQEHGQTWRRLLRLRSKTKSWAAISTSFAVTYATNFMIWLETPIIEEFRVHMMWHILLFKKFLDNISMTWSARPH